MARRDRHDQTPEDRFVIAAYEFFEWVALHKAVCTAVLVAAAAAMVGGLAWWNHLKAYNESAVAAFEVARKPEEFKALVEAYPGSSAEPLALFYQGRGLVDEKRYQEAGEVFVLLARSFPEHFLAPDARMFAAMVCVQQGNLDDALKNYRAVADEHPASFAAPRALLGAGACCESMNRPDDAKSFYGKIIEDYPASGVKKDAESRLARLGGPPPVLGIPAAQGSPPSAGTSSPPQETPASPTPR